MEVLGELRQQRKKGVSGGDGRRNWEGEERYGAKKDEVNR